MLYKIELVELLEKSDNSSYPKENKIYEQVLENIDIKELVCFLNKKPASQLGIVNLASKLNPPLE